MTENAGNSPKERLGTIVFFREKGAIFLQIVILIVFDGLLFVVWEFSSWLSDVIAAKMSSHERCVLLLHGVVPWFILTIAVIHSARDMVQVIGDLVMEIKSQIRRISEPSK